MPKSVEITLTNKLAWVTKASDLSYEKLDRFWSYSVPGARFTTAFRHGWDGRIKMFKRGSVAAGLFRATRWDAEEELGIKFKVTRDLPSVACALKRGKPIDKKYLFQWEAVEAMCAAVKRGGGIILAATGGGKTKLCADFFGRYPYNCLFVVDQIDLLHQSKEEIQHWLGEEVGIVGEGIYETRRITVATIQTLRAHMHDREVLRWFKKIKIVVVDELHVQMGYRHFSVLDKISPVARFGLTATLQLKSKHVRLKAYAFAGPVLYQFPYSEARDKGIVASGRVLQFLLPELYPGRRRNYQDEVREEILENDLKATVCYRIVKWLIENKRCVLVLVDRVAHVQLLTEMFASIKHGVAYGPVSRSIRDKAKRDFEAGKLHLLIANCVFKKGMNIKRVDAIVDMAEMKSKNDVQQKFGRGVRLHKNKAELLYIDIGTQTGRFAQAAVSRARALKKAGVKVITVQARGVTKVLAKLGVWARCRPNPVVLPKGGK